MPLAANRPTTNPDWLNELLHIALAYARRDDQTGSLTVEHARQALAAAPDEILAAAGIPPEFTTPATNTHVAAGWIYGPHHKPVSHHLPDATWCGTQPDHHHGHPAGIGVECWYYLAFRAHPQNPQQADWLTRRTFAALTPAAAEAGARAWADAGFPEANP